MQLKKLGALALCILTIIPFAGCTPKETETAQIETEEPKEELPREIRYNDPERRSYFDDELLEFYPELREMKEYLFETYPDVLVSKESRTEDARPSVAFAYVGGGGGDNIPEMRVTVNFKENVTKEQMIEACSYIMERLKEIIPSKIDTLFEAKAFIAYTNDGTPKEELVSASRGIQVSYHYLKPDELEWIIHEPPNNNWVAFDPNAPEQPAPEEVAAEEPPTAVASEVPMSKVSGVLSEVGFEITKSMETPDGYVLAGEDAEGFSSYMITLDKNKNLKGMTCTISEIGQPLTGNDFLVKAMTYMGVCVTIPYEEEETSKKALRFVLDNMDMGLLTLSAEEEKATIGGWDISLSYIEKSKTYMLYYNQTK